VGATEIEMRKLGLFNKNNNESYDNMFEIRKSLHRIEKLLTVLCGKIKE
jgi:hypothetical protein